MLDLQSSVHFQKIKITGTIHNKLNRASAGIAHRHRQRAGLFTHCFAGGRINKWRRRLFNHLLVPALDRTFTLAQIQAIAMRIRQDLNFNMTWLGDKLLDKNPAITKTFDRLVFRALKAFAGFGIVPGNAHAFAAAPRAGFDHHRVTNLIRNLNRVFGIRNQAHITGYGADPRLLSNLFARNLVTHRLDRPHRWSDKGDTSLFKCLGKFAVLRQKPVPGMYRLGATLCYRAHDIVDHDIRLIGGGWPDVHSLVSHLYMQCVFIGI